MHETDSAEAAAVVITIVASIRVSIRTENKALFLTVPPFVISNLVHQTCPFPAIIVRAAHHLLSSAKISSLGIPFWISFECITNLQQQLFEDFPCHLESNPPPKVPDPASVKNSIESLP